MDPLRQDFVYSWRRLRRSPGFSLVAILTLAIGIGANTALFGVVNAFLLATLPITGLDRMIGITTVRAREGLQTGLLRGISSEELRPIDEIVARHDTLESLAATDFVHGSLASPAGALVIFGEAVSGGYFQTAAVGPIIGRVLGPADDSAQAGDVIVLSEHVWRRQFGADPSVIGRTVRLTGRPMTVVGIVGDGFRGLYLPTLVATDVWVPLRDSAVVNAALPASMRTMPDADRHHRVLARLRPAVDPNEAAARIAAIGAHVDFAHGETGLAAVPAYAAIVPEEFDRYGRMFGVAIVALSGLVLLIACSNLTNLLLARTSARSVEIAVRMAAGASRSRIARLLLTETVLVTGAAAAAGIAIAAGLSRLLAALPLPEVDAGMTIHYVPSLDLHVFAYSFGVAVAVALAVGLTPTWRATRTDPVRTFANVGGAGGSSSRRGRLRGLLVGVQMAACTVLLVAAGLFIRSTMAGMAYDPGFDITRTAIADVNLAYDGYDEARGRAYFQRVIDESGRAPGIVASALASDVPAGSRSMVASLLAEGEAPIASSPGAGHGCNRIGVTPGFFATIGERLESGRDFNVQDTATSKAVVIINESVAKLLWPGQNPIGRRLSLEKDQHLLEVVGLVADTDHSSAFPSQWRYAFVPFSQSYSPRMSIVARGPSDGTALREPLRAVTRRADPDVAVTGVRTVAERVAIWLVPMRYAAMMLITLGVIGGLIAVVGIYGVTAYVVTLRTREFGILKALGATNLNIYRSVLTQGARTLVAGVGVGVGASFLAANLLQHLLYGVHPRDVLTFVAVPVALLAVGLFASFVPARRAASIDPNVALRNL